MPSSRPPASTARATIYDVADAAQVSIKTVSRVLRNEPRVAPETRERVRQTMRELDYLPHPGARSLASTVTSVIGLLNAAPVDFQAARRGGEYRMCLLTGAMAAASPLGFGIRLVPIDLSSPQTVDNLVMLVRTGGVGGYLVAPPPAEHRKLLDALVEAGLAVAVVGTAHAPDGCTVVTPAERAAMRELTGRVVALGHRRVGVLRGRSGVYSCEQRHAGCLDALVAAGLPPLQALVAGDGLDFESGQAAARQLLALPHPPTVIMANTDDGAAGVISVANERGLAVPAQLSVTGFDDLDLAHKLCPPLTTVRHPIERMVELATRGLVAQMHPQRRDISALQSRIEVACEIVERASLAPPLAEGAPRRPGRAGR